MSDAVVLVSSDKHDMSDKESLWQTMGNNFGGTVVCVGVCPMFFSLLLEVGVIVQ